MIASHGPVNNINQTNFGSALGGGVGMSNDPTREQTKEFSAQKLSQNPRRQVSNRVNTLNESSEVGSQLQLSFRPLGTPPSPPLNADDRVDNDMFMPDNEVISAPQSKV
jgi:hypothetical protein